MNEKQKATRADRVRQRHEREYQKDMQRVQQITARPKPATATRAKQKTKVVKRPVRKPAQNARRRFRITLPQVPRTGIRAISLPRLHFGWRSVSFILMAVLGTAIYFAFKIPQLRVMEAQVMGNQLLTPTDINSVLNISGQPIFMLIPSNLETRLRLNYPELASVQVTTSLPNVVSIHVLERHPVIRWEQGGGYTWVASDGVAFRPRGEIPELISVVADSAPPDEGSGSDPLNPAPFISVEMVQALKGLATHVPPGVPILYDARMGFGWDDPRGWRVYFGTSASDVELKMRVYESMVTSLTQRGIRPALINVTYPTAPYYRMTQ